MKIYITFGQVHTHRVNGRTFDTDCIAEIECEDYEDGRDKAFNYFGGEFQFSYDKSDISQPGFMKYFPRGIIKVEPGEG